MRIYHALPGRLEAVQTKQGISLQEALDSEQIALLPPLQPLAANAGSYDALRPSAEIVATSTLREHLPAEWRRLHENHILDVAGAPWCTTIPEFMNENEPFTKMSFLNNNADAKMFVRQMRYGTGSWKSTLDCVTDRAVHRLARVWSMDVEFLDDEDHSGCSGSRGVEYKMRLTQDYSGRKPAPVPSERPRESISGRARGRELLASYSSYSQSHCNPHLGRRIPESPPSLRALRYE